MSTSPIRLDLLEVIKIAIKWKKQILIFAFLVASITAVYMYMQKNIYTSYSSFYPGSALSGSRANFFRIDQPDGVDQLGQEVEVDRVFSVAQTAEIISGLMERNNMAKHYKIDIENDPKGKSKLYKRFAKNYKVSKGPYGNIEIMMTDENPQKACDIVNDALIAVQDKYRFLYNNSFEGNAQSLEKFTKKQDSVIALLTDSLVAMRNKYGIYEIISPSRKSEIKTNSTNARGIEEIQTVEELKDKYVIDRAKYESIINELRATGSKSIPFIHVVQYPTPSGEKAGPYRIKTVLLSAFIAVFAGVLIAVVVEYFQKIKNAVNLAE